MSKNAKQLFKENKFGIRKFTVGVASVIIGTSFYLGAENQAQAAETTNQTEMSSSQELSGANGGNNENVEADSTTTEQTNVAEQSTDQSNVETTTNDTESTTETPVNESVNTKEDTSSVESNETSKTDETNTNTEESTTDTNVESTTDTNASDKQIEEKTDNTTVATPKEEQPQNETTVDNNEKEANTSETNTVESKTEQPSTDNTEDRTTAGDNSKQDQSVNNNVEKETPKEESTTNNVENRTSVDDKSESNQSVNNNVEKETSKEETTETENKEEKSNDTTNNNKEEIAPKEDKSTSQSETTESNTKEEPKSEEVKNSSDESNKEDNKTVNDVETNSNDVSNHNTNKPVEPSVNVENDVDAPVQSEADSEISDASELNSITSPFVSLNALETAGSQPTDNPTDVANSALSQPVTAARINDESASENVSNETLGNSDKTTQLLSNDKYTIMSLTDENDPGDAYTKPTYKTHMTLKLDDSVKSGDVIEYGVRYGFKDRDGNITYKYLKHAPMDLVDGYLPNETPIIYNGVEVGKMTYESLSGNTWIDGFKSDFSLKELQDKNATVNYNNPNVPIKIEFNDNINDLKNVELQIDNVFVKDSELVMGGGSDGIKGYYGGDMLYKDPSTIPDGLIERDGKQFMPIENEFIINNEVKDLNLELPVVDVIDSVSDLKNNKTTDLVKSYFNNDRNYVRTKDGAEYALSEGNVSVDQAISPSGEKANEITVKYVVPKELLEYATFKPYDKQSINNFGVDQRYGTSKMNSLVNKSDVYTSYVKDVPLDDKLAKWDYSKTESTNENGDTVYTFNWKTVDGSYVNVDNGIYKFLNYEVNEDVERSPIESYDEVKSHGYGNAWSIPEWDKALAEHPITMESIVNHESGIKTNTFVRDKEYYTSNIRNVTSLPSGGIRILADNESLDIEHHEEVTPYDTIVNVDPTLSKDERIVDIEGIDGKHSWDEEMLYRNNEKVSTSIRNVQDITKRPEFVRIGVDNPISNEEPVNSKNEITQNIDYDTIREFDPNMEPNSKDIVIQEGMTGTKYIETHFVDGLNYTTIQTYYDYGDDFSNDEEYKAGLEEVQNDYKQNLIDKYGDNLQIVKDFTYNPETKQYEIEYIVDDEDRVITDKQDEIVKFAPVEFDYESNTEYTNKLPKDERKVEREGVKGLKNPETDKIIKDKVDELILIGTGIEGVKEDTITKEIPFDTNYTFDKTKPSGYIETTTEGQKGIEKTNITQKTIDGEPIGTPTYSEPVITQEKIDKEVVIGTGVVGKDTKVEDITTDYETDVRENDTLPVGTRNVIRKGQVGIDRKTTIHYTLNGEDDPTREDDVSTDHIQDKIDEIVEVGTAVEGTRTETKDVLIDFGHEEIEDSSLPKGETKIDQQGEKGIDRITTTYPTLNGEDSGEGVPSTEHIKDPVKEIVRIGTGVVGENKSTTTKTIPFETERVESDSIPEGETRVAREGENGEITITIKTPTLNGKDNGPSDESRVISKQPVNEIIKIGTGKLITKTSTTKSSKGFKVIYKETDELEKGQTKVLKHGQNGIVETITKQDYVNGEKYGDPDVTTNELQSVIDEIVLIGTKEPSNPVKPFDPDNNNYDSNGNDVTKDKGHKTTPKEITDQVEIPKYPSDKGTPVKTVEDETLIPDGNTTGDYTVPVVVTYPDGSKDYVGVIVHIIDTNDNESIVEKVIDKDTGEVVRTDNSNNETISTPNTKYVIDNNSSELIDDKGHIGIQMNKQHDGHTKYIIDEKPVQKDESVKENSVTNQTNTEKVDQLPETGNEQQSKTVTLGLITMAIGAALTFARRRKQKEDK